MYAVTSKKCARIHVPRVTTKIVEHKTGNRTDKIEIVTVRNPQKKK